MGKGVGNNFQYPLEEYNRNRWIIFFARKFTVLQKSEYTQVRKLPVGAVKLYMPNDFSESISQNWGAEEVFQEGAKNILKSEVARYISGKMGGGQAVAEFKRKTTQIRNPKEELLYMGPGFRNFSFNFEFVPKNATEEANIKRIIFHFRKNSLPEGSFNNTFIKFPPIWEIKLADQTFMDMGFRDRQFALTNIDTNFTPDGEYQTLVTGWPVKTTITLSFQETRVLYRDDLKEAL